MAKSEKRVKITLECTECKRRNFITVKSKINDRERLEMKKYSGHDHRHTVHGRLGRAPNRSRRQLVTLVDQSPRSHGALAGPC